MKLIRTNDGKINFEGYPTLEEIQSAEGIIQNQELNSDRYAKVRATLEEYYQNRANEDLEKELFKIVGNYELEYSLSGESKDYQKSERLKRYIQLKKFFKGLSEEQINSNAFLKITKFYMGISVEECEKMLSQLDLENQVETGNFRIDYPIPETVQKSLPEYVRTQCSIDCLGTDKIKHIYVLDYKHINEYYDFNKLVERITKIASDVFLLELNYQIVKKFNNLICYDFLVYHQGLNNKFIAQFCLYEPKKSVNKDNQVEEDFIETTIDNFQLLIDLGIIEITPSQEDKGKPYILKRKL